MQHGSLAPPAPTPARLLLLFFDGIGLAPAGPQNPLAVVPAPGIHDLLGGPLTIEQLQQRPGLCLRALDATLGVPGLPQSATGQTSLYTGVNAARKLGHHVAAFPGPRLRRILERASLFRALQRRGHAFTLANAYAPSYAAQVHRRRLRWPASAWALWAGGGHLRGAAELERGEAVTWDVVGDLWGAERALSTPEQAGRDLAALAAAHRLTLFESHLTDLAGHGRGPLGPAEALRRIDGLLAGALANLTPDVTLAVVSDHGNFEAGEHRLHTRNPVPLLVFGHHAANFRRVRSITGLVPAVLRVLDPGATTSEDISGGVPGDGRADG
jgi:2,3-bisphosphoglycerate-independent phosphoglycerate mutase